MNGCRMNRLLIDGVYWGPWAMRDHMVLSERCPFRKPTNQDDSNGEIVKTYLAKIWMMKR